MQASTRVDVPVVHTDSDEQASKASEKCEIDVYFFI